MGEKRSVEHHWGTVTEIIPGLGAVIVSSGFSLQAPGVTVVGQLEH